MRHIQGKSRKQTVLFVIVLALALLLSCGKDDEGLGTPAICFFVLSDWGWNASEGQIAVARQMGDMAAVMNPDFVMTCGDNFQYGCIQSADDSMWRINFEQVYDCRCLEIPWYPALGNHDYSGDVDAEIEYSKKNSCWCMPARYYSFTKDCGDMSVVQFIVLDTQDLLSEYNNLTDTADVDSIEQVRWLKDVLSGTNHRWVFVTGHHPLYSGSTYHGDTRELIRVLEPVFEYYGVDFYICGHDHDFEHASLPGKHTEYIITGTGGDSRPVAGNSRTVFCLSTLGFTAISVSGEIVRLDFITSQGDTAYSFTKAKVGG